MNRDKILPVILSGGSGSRLWPLSRSSYPKQYLPIKNKKSLTFFQETIKRISDNQKFDSPLVICNEEDRFVVAEQLRNIDIKAKSILLEPIGRNTAPAITLAAIKSMENGEDPLLLVLPSDHLINDLKKFQYVLEKARAYCEEGKLLTFGITPNRAETGYGYIKALNVLDKDKLNCEKIERFIEKPNKELAEKLLMDKKFSWNSGMYFFKASNFIKELKRKNEEIYNLCKKSLNKENLDLDFQRLEKKYFSNCKNISIDNAIMEGTNEGFVIPLEVGWFDIGSWQSMWDVSDKDKNGNVTSGNVFLKDISNSYLRSEERLVVAIGLEEVVIVETLDAILVANKNKVQEVKNIVKDLEKKGKIEAKIHKKIYRPWGNFTSIKDGANWQVKKITVNTGESLSLQMHKYRAENWIVVSGKALVEINGEEKIIKQNESVFIPPYSKHRLSNPFVNQLNLIEVQCGTYLGEDDIIRFEDKYGRLK